MNDYIKYTYLRIILVLLVLLFAVSLFKNISYPLFWADESMTVMHGERVLEYGYPKVHDGKNVLYDLSHPNLALGLDKKTDAFIGGANWGQYYIAAIAVKIAETTDDIYAKTGIIRIIFALIGLAGLAIFAFLATQFFYSGQSKTVFLLLFVFLELISVPLVLHLREARYYPMTIFLVAFTVFVYSRYRILNKTGYPGFLSLLTVSLFLLFVTFSPAYFILLASISLFETTLLAKDFFRRHRTVRSGGGPGVPTPSDQLFKRWLRGMLPLTLSLIAVSPLLSFFRMFHIAEEMSKVNTLASNTDAVHMYLNNLSIIWRFFASSDYIYLAILLKAGLLVCFALQIFHEKPLPIDRLKAAFSSFLTMLFIVYIIAIAKIPNFPFTRYFISLQPVLTLIIILDAAVIYNFLSQYRPSAIFRSLGIALFMGFVFFNISQNMTCLEGHIYELSHPFKGPLDYVIPAIRNNYANTERLVIATNYEETSFMYYLNAKVIVGFVGNNLEQDSLVIPDVIVYRKTWGNLGELFSAFFAAGRYRRMEFPAVDYPINNLPELNWSPPWVHRFRTEETGDKSAQVDIYLRM